jgi:hypothetical protein
MSAGCGSKWRQETTWRVAWEIVLVLVLDPESLRSEDEDEHEGRGRFPEAIRPLISLHHF